jgi:DNA repair exonuclease SbcCD ATPase subunit
MATTEDIARLILESTTRGFPDAKKQIDDLEAKLEALKAQYSSGAIDIDAYFEEGRKLQGGLDQLKGGVKAAEDALKKYGDASKAAAALTGQATSKLAGFGQVGLQLGRFAQDFQAAGFMGIANNIEGLVQALGGGPGLAGTLTLLGTAYLIFKPKLDEFFRSLQNEAPSLLSDRLMALKKQIDDIEKKPIKLSADITELENARKELQALEEARKAFEEFGKLRPEPTKKSGEEVQKALAEAPGGAGRVREVLERAAVAQAQANDQAVQAAEFEMEDAKRRIRENEEALKSRTLPAQQAQAFVEDIERQKKFINASEEKKNTALDLAAQRARDEIGDLYKDAVAGDVARQRELQQKLREVGEGELAKQIRAVSPENIRAKQLEEEGGKIEEEARKELAQAEKERAEEDAKRIEEQLQNRDVIEKELAKQTDDARKKQDAAEKRRLATLAKRIGGGTLGEEAEAYAARVQERQPGISDADLRAEVSRAVSEVVARRAPQLAPAERAGVTTAVTEQALAAPPEDVAARQARAAAALPRQERAEMQAGYAQEAQARGANPQQAAQIGRLATAAFAKTGDLQGSFMQGVMEFQQIMGRMLAQQQGLMNGMQQVHANNRNMQARLQTAQKEWGR